MKIFRELFWKCVSDDSFQTQEPKKAWICASAVPWRIAFTLIIDFFQVCWTNGPPIKRSSAYISAWSWNGQELDLQPLSMWSMNSSQYLANQRSSVLNCYHVATYWTTFIRITPYEPSLLFGLLSGAKENNVTLVTHITLIRPNTSSLKGAKLKLQSWLSFVMTLLYSHDSL